MKNKIVLEEHFATADTIGDSQEYFPDAARLFNLPNTSDVRQTQRSGAHRRGIRGRLTQMDDGAPAEAVPG